MRAGKLRTKVTFQSANQTPDGGGGFAETWGNDKVVFCEFRTQSAREAVQAGRLEETSIAVLSARSLSVSFLDAGWRALIDGVVWNVRSVTPDDQRQKVSNISIERHVAT